MSTVMREGFMHALTPSSEGEGVIQLQVARFLPDMLVPDAIPGHRIQLVGYHGHGDKWPCQLPKRLCCLLHRCCNAHCWQQAGDCRVTYNCCTTHALVSSDTESELELSLQSLLRHCIIARSHFVSNDLARCQCKPSKAGQLGLKRCFSVFSGCPITEQWGVISLHHVTYSTS